MSPVQLVPAERLLLQLLGQAGDRYVFGSEASPLDPDPDLWDCSEIIEWGGARSGIEPRLPDGAYNQWLHCSDLAISVDEGVATRSALLFAGDGTGVGRDAITHVAVSLGDGTSFEARGSKWGVGVWAVRPGRFQYAALIPGVDYQHTTEEAQMQEILDTLKRVELRAIDAQNRGTKISNALAGFQTDSEHRRLDGTSGTQRRLSVIGEIAEAHGIDIDR